MGEGAYASVYLGIQESLGRKVAVKVLDPYFLRNKETAIRFVKEARTAASLSHSNIIQIYDTGRAGDYYSIVMEYLVESLKERMRYNCGKLPLPIALDIVETIMKALDYAHFRGIFHRDIKPENIMFKQDSTPVLVDFGIAGPIDLNDKLTKTGVSIGTSDYMSPEQCKSQKGIDGRSDIYSLGVIFYEMLTGTKPYKGDSYIEIALQHIEKPVPRLPREFARYQPLIDKMMAKDRKKRLSTAPEFEDLYYSILSEPLSPEAKDAELSPTPKIETPAPLPVESPSFSIQPGAPDLIAGEPGAAPVKSLNKVKTAALGVSLGIILILLTIWVVSLFTGKDHSKKEITTTNKDGISIGTERLEPEYKNKYNQALQYIEQGEFENAELIIEELGKIKMLEREVAALKEKLFAGYLTVAKTYFDDGFLLRAKDTLRRAKKIKITDELLRLESDIDAALSQTKQQ